MDQQDRISCFTAPEIAEVMAVNRYDFRSYRRLTFFGFSGNKATLKIIYKCFDFGLRDLTICDYAEQRSYWQHISFACNLAPQDTVGSRFHDPGDLVAFDFNDSGPCLDHIAGLRQPSIHLAFRHR